MWILIASALGCEETVDAAGFRETLDDAWNVLIDGDPDAFRRSLLTSERALGCLPEPIRPGDAARLFRNRAMASQITGDSQGARMAARAARHLEPELLRDTWAVQVPELAEIIDEVIPQFPTEEFSTSLAAKVFVDGRPTAERQLGQPAVIQVFGADGKPVGAALLDGREPVPEWVTYPPIQCDTRWTTEELLEQVDRAKRGFADLDVGAFEVALQGIAEGLPCLKQPLKPSQAASIHRLEGIRLYTHGSRLATVRSFQESQMLDSAFEPPDFLIAAGSSLDGLWNRASQVAAPPWLDTGVSGELDLLVDGIPTRQRPATLPTIVQVIGPGGEVVWTRYVPAGAPMPGLDSFVSDGTEETLDRLPPALAVYRRSERRRGRRGVARGLQLGGALLIAGSGLVYAVNVDHAADFYDRTALPSELPRMRRAVNRSAIGATTLLVAGGVSIGASFTLP